MSCVQTFYEVADPCVEAALLANRGPLCRPTCSDDSSCCAILATESWNGSDCPEGYVPDWCDRLNIMQEAYPGVFDCVTSAQLARAWDRCIVPKNKCICAPELLRELLLCHHFVVRLKFDAAYEAALMAGAMRGYARSAVPVVNSSGGPSAMGQAWYALSSYGLEYLAHIEASRRNISGAFGMAKRSRRRGAYAV